MEAAIELPVLGQDAPERADAARNRARILATAERLYDRHGVDDVTVAQVAAAAGVGKGTVYRRFGDQNGLALALLDAHERRFQDALLSGPPPLGPGAPPAQRLQAFATAALHLVVAHNDLYRLAERGGSRTTTGLYAFYRTHVAHLLARARPDLDAGYHPDLVLAPLDAYLVHHQLTERGLTEKRIRTGICAALDALIRRGGRDEPGPDAGAVG